MQQHLAIFMLEDYVIAPVSAKGSDYKCVTFLFSFAQKWKRNRAFSWVACSATGKVKIINSLLFDVLLYMQQTSWRACRSPKAVRQKDKNVWFQIAKIIVWLHCGLSCVFYKCFLSAELSTQNNVLMKCQDHYVYVI